MIRRWISISLLLVLALLAASCSHKVSNPIANVNSAQPDKVLFDRAMDAMQHGRFDVARITLQTMINTYPDSEYIARAKLAVGDSWYAEGGSAGLAQAEIEYKDFITFFPNLPEAAEAQLKVANIHFRQMEKPDRDFTHAKRAEEEYKQLILQFPDSKLVPEAKQRLREVQEVLAEREYRIGRFYYLREAWPAAIARLQSVADIYPLYSGVDDALYLLGQCYEQEASGARTFKITKDFDEAKKAALIKSFEDQAAAAYSKILTRYPVMERAKEAKERMAALHRPVPKATVEAVAQNKSEEESRRKAGHFEGLMLNFRRRPDMSQAAKVGDPTLVPPQQTNATDVTRRAQAALTGGSAGAGGKSEVKLETVGKEGVAPPPNQPAPRSDTTSAPSGNAGTDNSIPVLKPAGEAAQPSTQAPQNPPTQLNEAAAGDSQSTSSSTAQQGSSASTDSGSQQSQQSQDDSQSSSSKKKKKKGLKKIVPF